MRNLLLACGIVVAASVGAFAAEPAKMADTQAGTVLVTPAGMTLYIFDKDKDGKSACDEKCLKMWPAFHTEGSAMAEGDFSIVKSSDGKDMWAYKGKPLYLYHEDMAAGDAKGDGKGGVWHVVK
ncbi:hypothetical protein DKP76_08420 [Falsochrobactrum shanghaiense]|uniref:Lipoprotein with Yx(FWY)xxD motif n=1 Tax=Falsochrobactrum shanghaiense TaxID=2201899 RepID=A0A316J8F8_9HYPH|nr:hypothetical protein [Falsochrobactrum shanghaiense]PWL17784.1 hypothetical protein DKP76_08420 [Falsochrobactrum shanghaiense]